MNKAEELRAIVDSNYNSVTDKAVKKIFDLVIKGAELNAKQGSTSHRTYDDKLLNSEVCVRLKKLLVAEGFKVSIAEDHAYTEHAGSLQMYVEVNW